LLVFYIIIFFLERNCSDFVAFVDFRKQKLQLWRINICSAEQ
jgi:hypothetical protein